MKKSKAKKEEINDLEDVKVINSLKGNPFVVASQAVSQKQHSQLWRVVGYYYRKAAHLNLFLES